MRWSSSGSSASSSKASGLPANVWCSRSTSSPGRCLTIWRAASSGSPRAGSVGRSASANGCGSLLPCGDEQHDRIRYQAPSREQQGFCGRTIEQMRVVDDDCEGRLFGVAADQAECGRTDGEAICRDGPVRVRAREASAACCGPGMRSRLSSAGRSSWSRAPKGTLLLGFGTTRSQRPGVRRPERRPGRGVRSYRCRASPVTSSTPAAPTRAPATNCSITRHSASRPMSMSRSVHQVPHLMRRTSSRT